jgi:hypothetical protein
MKFITNPSEKTKCHVRVADLCQIAYHDFIKMKCRLEAVFVDHL